MKRKKFNPYWGVRVLRARIERAEEAKPVLKPRPIWVPPRAGQQMPSAHKADLRKAQATERRRQQFCKRVKKAQVTKTKLLRKHELAAAKAVKSGLTTRFTASAKAALRRAESQLETAKRLRSQIKAARAFLKAEKARKHLLDAAGRKRIKANKAAIRRLRSGVTLPVDNRWRKAFLKAFTGAPGLEVMVAFVKAA